MKDRRREYHEQQKKMYRAMSLPPRSVRPVHFKAIVKGGEVVVVPLHNEDTDIEF